MAGFLPEGSDFFKNSRFAREARFDPPDLSVRRPRRRQLRRRRDAFARMPLRHPRSPTLDRARSLLRTCPGKIPEVLSRAFAQFFVSRQAYHRIAVAKACDEYRQHLSIRLSISKSNGPGTHERGRVVDFCKSARTVRNPRTEPSRLPARSCRSIAPSARRPSVVRRPSI